MKIKFTEGFFKSLIRIANRERWYWKIWDFFRYDLSNGIKNIFFFWRIIWRFRSYDSSFQLRLLARSLEPLAKELKDGNEVEVTRLKKVEKIQRAIEILNNQSSDSYIELAEKQLGYKVDLSYFLKEEPAEISELNNKIYRLSDHLENSEWEELFEILKGQPHSEFCELVDKNGESDNPDDDLWPKWYNGSGLKHWWN